MVSISGAQASNLAFFTFEIGTYREMIIFEDNYQRRCTAPVVQQYQYTEVLLN